MGTKYQTVTKIPDVVKNNTPPTLDQLQGLIKTPPKATVTKVPYITLDPIEQPHPPKAGTGTNPGPPPHVNPNPPGSIGWTGGGGLYNTQPIKPAQVSEFSSQSTISPTSAPVANTATSTNTSAPSSNNTQTTQTNNQVNLQNAAARAFTASVSPTGQYTAANPVTDYQKVSMQTPDVTVQSTPKAGTAHNAAPKKVSTKKPAPSKSKKPPSYSDSEYRNELRYLAKALADYKAKMGIQKTRAGTEYGTSKKELGQQRNLDLKDIADDFAARGIIKSGVYATKLGDYNKSYGNQVSDLERHYKDSLSDIGTNYTDFLREQELQREQAKLDAVRRRAQKLGKI